MTVMPDDPKECIDCNKPIPDGWQYRIGPNMWHMIRWTCKHESTLVCKECYNKRTYRKCSVITQWLTLRGLG
jgi:hypothetical protein